MKNSNELPIRCQRLKELRKQKNMTQAEVAKKIDVTEKTYRSWEIGNYQKESLVLTFPKPDLDSLIALADLFDCSIDYLIGLSNCKSVNNHYISRETGLSEDNINRLIKWYSLSKRSDGDYSWASNSLYALNALLDCDMWFTKDVLEQITNYCYYRSLYETKSDLTNAQRTKCLNNFQLSLFNATNGLRDCIEKDIYKNAKENITNMV